MNKNALYKNLVFSSWMCTRASLPNMKKPLTYIWFYVATLLNAHWAKSLYLEKNHDIGQLFIHGKD